MKVIIVCFFSGLINLLVFGGTVCSLPSTIDLEIIDLIIDLILEMPDLVFAYIILVMSLLFLALSLYCVGINACIEEFSLNNHIERIICFLLNLSIPLFMIYGQTSFFIKGKIDIYIFIASIIICIIFSIVMFLLFIEKTEIFKHKKKKIQKEIEYIEIKKNKEKNEKIIRIISYYILPFILAFILSYRTTDNLKDLVLVFFKYVIIQYCFFLPFLAYNIFTVPLMIGWLLNRIYPTKQKNNI